jgi:hypothetical protein
MSAPLPGLIQQHKLYDGRKGTTSCESQTSAKSWSNLRSHSTVNASVSKYKKINVNTKFQVPLADTMKSYSHKLPQSGTVNCASSPAISSLHESQPLTYGASYAPCQDVPDSRSSRLYLNPHFLKGNSCLQSDITAESTEVPQLKQCVHINPKVLASQVMKLTTLSEPSQTHVVANTYAGSNKHKTQLGSCEMVSQPPSSNSATMKYIFHSKTKLVKQNVLVQQTSTNNTVRNPGTTLQFMPEKISPLIKSSLSGPVMSVSRTRLVRAKPRSSSQSFQCSANRPPISAQDTFPTRPKAAERLSGDRRNSFKSSKVAVKAANAVCSKHKLSRSNIAKTPVTKSLYSYSANKTTPRQESRYKIDRRRNRSLKRLKKVKKYSLQYGVPKQGGANQRTLNPKLFSKYEKVQYPFMSLKFGNETWNNSLHPRRVIVTNKKLRRM